MQSMPSWGSASFMFGPLVAFAVVAVLAGLLKWTFGHGHSLVERPSTARDESSYGLLVAVATVTGRRHAGGGEGAGVEAERMCRTLSDAGIRATRAVTATGEKIMVFAVDEQRARQVLGTRLG
jgi:hypothetical protein